MKNILPALLNPALPSRLAFAIPVCWLALFAIAPSASATAYVSAGSGLWATTTTWTPNGTPGAADTVEILTGNIVTNATASQAVGVVTIDSGGIFKVAAAMTAGFVTNNGTLTVGTGTSARTLTLTNNLVNIGTINGDTSQANVIAFGGTSRWLGSGDITGGKILVSVTAAKTLDISGLTTPLTFKNPGTLASTISGTLITGTQVINGNANGTCSLTLASGATLITANPNGIINGPVGTFNFAGTVTLNAGANYTFNGTAAQVTLGLPALVNSLTISNSAGVSLSANTAVTGTLALNVGGAGEYTDANIATLLSTGQLGSSPGTLTLTNGAVLALNPINASSSTFTCNSTIQNQYGSTNNLGLYKPGAGTLIVGGNNTFTGPVTLPNAASTAAGWIQVASSTALGPDATSKTINLTSSTGNGAVGGIQLIGGVTVNNKNILVGGRGTTPPLPCLQNLSGSNIWNGDLKINNSGGLYYIESAAGTLVLGGTIQNPAGGNRGFTLLGAGNGIISGSLVDGGSSGILTSLTVASGSGTWSLTGANTFSGGLTVSGGQLNISTATSSTNAIIVGNGAKLGVNVASLGATLNASTLTLNTTTTTLNFQNLNSTATAALTCVGNLAANGTTTINITNGTFVAPNNYPLIAYATRSGAGSFVLGSLPPGVTATLNSSASPITLQVTAAPVPVVPGIVWNGDVSAAWDTTSANWKSGGTTGLFYQNTTNVIFDDTLTGASDVTLNTTVSPVGVVFNNLTTSYSISGSGKITGPTSLQKNGSGSLILASGNDYSGGTSLAGGTLQVGNGGTAGAFGSGAVTVTGSGTTLAFNRTDAITATNTISASGGIPNLQINSGAVTLGGSSDNPGAIATVNTDATLVLGKISSASVHALNGATVNPGGNLQLAGSGGNQINDSASVTLAGGAFDLAGQTETLTAVNGFGLLTNSTGNGVLNLAGLASQNGTLTISGGTLTMSGSLVAQTDTLMVNGGTLNLYNNGQSAGGTGVQGGGNFIMNGGVVNGGNFAVGNTTSSDIAYATFNGGTFNEGSLANTSQLLNGFKSPAVVTVGGGAVLNLYTYAYGDQSLTSYFNGGTINTYIFKSRGSGDLEMYFNGVTIQPIASVAGFFPFGTGYANQHAYISTNGLNLNLATFAIGIGQSLEHDSALDALGATPDGGLSIHGGGTLTLSGASTYTGNTVVSNATLNVTCSLVAGVDVKSGATLTGTGPFTGPVTVESGGTLAPRIGAIGTLTINNDLTLQAGSSVSVEVNQTAATSALVTGLNNVTYGGTLVVTNLSGTLTAGNQFTLFSAANPANNFSSISGTPGTNLAWSFNPTNGVLSVVSTMATNPTNITAVVSGLTLTLSWPTDHLGWVLQTNSLNIALPADWFDVVGSEASTTAIIDMDPMNPSVFFRLRSP